MSDINEVREWLASISGVPGARVSAESDDIRALLADHERLPAVLHEGAAALAGLTGFVATDVVESCNGSKCREPWCAGCCGDEAAEQAVSEARSALAAARAAIDTAKAVQS